MLMNFEGASAAAMTSLYAIVGIAVVVIVIAIVITLILRMRRQKHRHQMVNSKIPRNDNLQNEEHSKIILED